MHASRLTTALLTRRWNYVSNNCRLGAWPVNIWWSIGPAALSVRTRCHPNQLMCNAHIGREYSSDSSPSSLSVSNLDIQEFHQISDQTLDDLTEVLERLVESDHPEVTGWDVDYSNGVMNFSMGKRGTYVINKQPPNKQIWLSSPISGPKRFDYDKSRKCWFYSREGNELIGLLALEVDSILGNNSFSKLLPSPNVPQQ